MASEMDALSNRHDGVNLENVSLVTTADFLRLDAEISVHRAFNLEQKLKEVPSFKTMMSAIVTDEQVNQLHAVCHELNIVTDEHVEQIALPDVLWGVPYLAMTTEQRNIVRHMFHKRLADIVSEWKFQDMSSPWVPMFQRYK